MLTEAAQHLRAEKVPNRHQHHPDDGHRDQEAPLLPPKQINTGPAVNMNKCINLSLNSMLTPATTTIEPESSSASPPMSLASGQHVRLNEDIDVAALRAENVTLTASNVRYQAAAAQQDNKSHSTKLAPLLPTDMTRQTRPAPSPTPKLKQPRLQCANAGLRQVSSRASNARSREEAHLDGAVFINSFHNSVFPRGFVETNFCYYQM
jgi:hypothetical protein